MATFETPLGRVIDGKSARALRSLELETCGDLMRHYPRRWSERAALTDLSGVREGELVTVLAEVQSVSGRKMKSREGFLVEAEVTDGRQSLKVAFFNQPFRQKELAPGRRGLFTGKVTRFNRGWQLAHPDCMMLDGDLAAGEAVDDFFGALIAVYPAGAKVASWIISRSAKLVLDALDPVPDPLPARLRARRRLIDLGTALHDIHRPPDLAALKAAQRRLTWDEALVLQVALAQRRHALGADPATPRPARDDGLQAAFDARLPFTLTAGQREVGDQIAADLAGTYPMHRLLQGEVGAGKTLVALRAMLQVVDGGGQAVLLAPTEVLAAQHARNLRDLLGPLARAGELGAAGRATRLTLLTGSLSAPARRAALLDAASGAAGIVVGTHALIQDKVAFADLGLVVIDEQHRFGVEQRDALRGKGDRPPHLLVMTATPIPRTVAMTVFGDLEISTLRELPGGRAPISTAVVPVAEKPAWLDRAWQRVTEEVAAGYQVYVVCPRIGAEAAADDVPDQPADEGTVAEGPAGADRRPPQAVADVLPMLVEGPLAGLRLAALHGRLPPDGKDDVMRRFTAGEIDVLVATTVVEVGVDVSNATMMLVLDADRFGVSQLHQLRGRVGRGTAPGLCLLVTDAPPGTPARRRLDAVASTVDGFELARLDLEQRREGDVLGAAQSGRRKQVKLLSLLRDEQLIADAREEATALVGDDPELARHPVLAAEIAVLLTDDRAEYLEKA
ncbi:MAG TPA: ATP-dependent DNA helicase RecG [Mycobacteriales bacterium]|nr:ATP-dependent DNA helicase RecG [Mycobacteriales bacterium]